MTSDMHGEFEFREHEGNASDWDARLARVDGHPLQSAMWGRSRAAVDNLKSLYLEVLQPDRGVQEHLCRIETRNTRAGIRVAWLPKACGHIYDMRIFPGLLKELKRRGYSVCASTPYTSVENGTRHTTQTIQLDLSQNLELIESKLHKDFRYGVRVAERESIVVQEEPSDEMIEQFASLCRELSETKQFSLSVTAELIRQLKQNASPPPLTRDVYSRSTEW